MTLPSRTLACGALGSYDRDRVLAIAQNLPGEPPIVHEDSGSILALDRKPISWRARGNRGLAWSERIDDLNGSRINSWAEAATAGAACGLVIERRRRFLHSSVAGVARLYFIPDGEAVYFATTVDALACSSPRRLSVDWDAWAAILTLRNPLGDRTPFAEIRHLPPYSTVEIRRGKLLVTEEAWPWAEVEPRLDIARGAGDVVESLRASTEQLPPGPVVCQLSGGLDSRLCLGLLTERRRSDVSALTVDPDTGTDAELQIASELAAMSGVPHESVAGGPAEFWPEFNQRSLLVDYQFVRPPWRMPKLARLRAAKATVVDGFGFDSLAVPGNRWLSRKAVDPRGGDAVVEAVWRGLKASQEKAMPWLVGERLATALWASAHRQFLAESQRFAGHPARSVLTMYRTRQVRGVSLAPAAILGASVPVATPLVDDRVARSALAISPLEKLGAKLYAAVFEAIGPELWAVRSTSRADHVPGQALPRRNHSEPVVDALRSRVLTGPLAPWVRPRAVRALTRHHRGKTPWAGRGTLGVATFHLWSERYASVLGEVDVAAGFGVPHRIATAPDSTHPSGAI